MTGFDFDHMPKVGDRDDNPGGSFVLEWTGSTWAPVCPADNVAMVEHDVQGWLCCGTCGARTVDVGRPA
jgi:hypothetical protein